jgi:hypothetical protein
MTKVTDLGELSWHVVRVAGEDSVGGDLSVEEGELRFRPGKWQGSASAAWTFSSPLAGIAEITTVERTLHHLPWSIERGIRVRTVDGSQATFYLVGRARDRADVVVAGVVELVKSASGPSETIATRPATAVDLAEHTPLGGSASAFRSFRRYSWLFGLFGIVVFTPELVATLRDAPDGLGFGHAWVLVYPGNFIAIGIYMVIDRFVSFRNHPLLAVLPLSLYLVGTSILALILYAFYVVPTSAALAPLLFGIPAAIVAAVTLSPTRRRAWREARDNDQAAALL